MQTQTPETDQPALPPAPLLARLRAALIDWFVLQITALVLTVATSSCLFIFLAYLNPDYAGTNPEAAIAWLIGATIAIHGSFTLLLTLRPTIWPVGRTGQSAAMAWAGISLVDRESGSPVGVPRSFARELPKLASMLVVPLAVLSLYGVSPFGLSWLVIAFAAVDAATMLLGEDRLTLMDRLLDTRVVVVQR